MRIVRCPKCSGNRCSEMTTQYIGEAVRMQCQGCGYYAERKEFKIEEIEVAINSTLDEIITDLKVIKDYLEQVNSDLV